MTLSIRDKIRRFRRIAATALATKTIRMRNERAIVSFSFDDFPRSAVTNGARILEKHGVTGSFYASGQFCGGQIKGIHYFEASDLPRLTTSGHEIGCHTFSHIRVSDLSAAELSNEIARNAMFIEKHVPGYSLSTFAYPYGDLSLLNKFFLQRVFAACRSSIPGSNAGIIDLGCIRAIPLYERATNLNRVAELIDKTVERTGWVIFYTHDVDIMPSPFGCTPDLLESTLLTSIDKGAEIIPVKNAIGAIRFGLH